jgi:hypothetical protein
MRHYVHHGELSQIDQAITNMQNALRCIPDGHPTRPLFLTNLASAFSHRFEGFAALHDLERALSIMEEVAALTDGRHQVDAVVQG